MKKTTFQEMEKFVNDTYPVPNEDDIADTIRIIKERLGDKAINRSVNLSVKMGYEKSVDLLGRRQKDYDGIDSLPTTQSRAIAAISIDYLNGKCNKKVLCSVPIVGGKKVIWEDEAL